MHQILILTLWVFPRQFERSSSQRTLSPLPDNFTLKKPARVRTSMRFVKLNERKRAVMLFYCVDPLFLNESQSFT